MKLRGTGWHVFDFEVADVPPEPIPEGEPFIVYQIQPGDEVVIPSHFAMRTEGGGVEESPVLDIWTTGPARLRVPGGFIGATRVDEAGGGLALPSVMVDGGDALEIRLDAASIPDGRGRLRLERAPGTVRE